MAIYDVEAVNEAMQQNEEEPSVLDNMLEACEYMLDALDESARNKWVKMQADKYKDDSDKLEAEVEKAREREAAGDSKGYEEHMDKVKKLYNNASHHVRDTAKYINGSFLGVGTDIKDELARTKAYSNKNTHVGDYDRHKAGERFKKDFGGPDREDKLANKKPGSVLAAQEKKRAIKETCLHILSVLDEIE